MSMVAAMVKVRRRRSRRRKLNICKHDVEPCSLISERCLLQRGLPLVFNASLGAASPCSTLPMRLRLALFLRFLAHVSMQALG